MTSGSPQPTPSDPVSVEFLVEPFTEGSPGRHVQAALAAFAKHDLDVELGPFASVTTGEVGALADGVADMIRAAMSNGATAVRIRVGSGHVAPGVSSLHDALETMVRAAEQTTGTAADEWDRAQKQAVVRMLDEQGAFLLRGAVDDIAKVMGVSRITIYNYLGALNGQ